MKISDLEMSVLKGREYLDSLSPEAFMDFNNSVSLSLTL
jgi:hypothetical protein